MQDARTFLPITAEIGHGPKPITVDQSCSNDWTLSWQASLIPEASQGRLAYRTHLGNHTSYRRCSSHVRQSFDSRSNSWLRPWHISRDEGKWMIFELGYEIFSSKSMAEPSQRAIKLSTRSGNTRSSSH
ncbi:hypothetical protein KCU62_g424, partial [Aureobasidium sp. EXF-3399]